MGVEASVGSGCREVGGSGGPGGRNVRIAAFRSPETRRLSRELGFEVAVVAPVEDPDAHAAWLSRRWYGALRVRENWFTAFDTWDVMPSTTRFERFAFDARWMAGAALPEGLEHDDGSLRVHLPPGATREGFATAFKAGMADQQFDAVAKRPGAVAYRFRTGRPLVAGARYGTPPRFMRQPIMVDDLYAFRPRAFPFLVRRASEALTLVGVRSALNLVARRGSSRDA